jgi:hypothetical protein
MVAGNAGILLMLMHLGALVDDPPHERAAVTQRFPPVNPDGNVTVGVVEPCPEVIGVVDPFNVQL